MQTRLHKISKRTMLPLTFGLLVLVVVVFILLYGGQYQYNASRYLMTYASKTEYKLDWELIKEDKSRAQVRFEEDMDFSANQLISIKCRLPEKLPTDATLFFFSDNQAVMAYLDDELIYVWDNSAERAFGKASPSAWNFIEIPYDSGGKEVSVSLVSPYEKAARIIHTISLRNKAEAHNTVLMEFLPNYIICLALFFFGLVLYLIALILTIKKCGDKSVQYLGTFVALAALCLRMRLNIPTLFIFNEYVCMQLKYLLVMLCPMPYILFLKNRPNGSKAVIVNISFWIFAANFIVNTVLQILNIADFYETAFVTRILLVLLTVMSIYLFFNGLFKEGIPFNLLKTLGLAMLIAGFIIELMVYYTNDFRSSGIFMCLGIIIYIIFIMADIIGHYVEQVRIREITAKELQESRMQLLTNQIKPHFIYNTLSAIRAQISENPEAARTMVYDFSKHLRANIDSITNTGLIPFSQELDHIIAYANIEKVRFIGNVFIEYDIRATDFEIPPLTVQPLVENAIKHGIIGRPNGGTVWISAYDAGDEYRIQVKDNGSGFNISLYQNKKTISTGLDNIKFRLSMSINAQLIIQSVPDEGTTATIIIPKKCKVGNAKL